MKHYGLDMQGAFNGQKVSSLSLWTVTDEGRLIYAEDTNTYYYGSNSGWVELTGGGTGGSGVSLPLIIPSSCSLDDTDDDVSRGNAFGMVETINFGSISDGAVWFSFQFPATFDTSKDINLDIFYNLNGADDSKIVTIQTKFWLYGNSTTPNPVTPTGTNSNNISTGTGMNGKRLSTSLNPIISSFLTAGHTITLKITRLSTDTYTGTFQMLYIYMYQNA